MKRLFLIFIAVLFCIGMSVPAMAAEPQEYVFEIMPPISMLDNYDFLPSADCTGVYEGYLPEGVYYVEIVIPSGEVVSHYFVDVFYDVQSDDGFSFSEFIGSDSTRFLVFDFLDYSGMTLLLIDSIAVDDEVLLLEDGCFVRFTSAEEVAPNTVEMIDLIHADLFGSFLICGTLIGLALFRGNRHA